MTAQSKRSQSRSRSHTTNSASMPCRLSAGTSRSSSARHSFERFECPADRPSRRPSQVNNAQRFALCFVFIGDAREGDAHRSEAAGVVHRAVMDDVLAELF